MNDDKVRQFPAHRRATGYEHMTNEEFFIAAFGRHVFDLWKTCSPEERARTWISPADPARADDIMREFKRRCGTRIVPVTRAPQLRTIAPGVKIEPTA